MEEFDIVKLIIVAGMGGLFTYLWQRKSEIEKKRREFLGSKLESAFNSILQSYEYPTDSPEIIFEKKKRLEAALREVHMFGSKKAIIEANKIVEGYAQNKEWIEYGNLALEIRNMHRENYGLEKVTVPVKTIVFRSSKPTTKPNNEDENFESKDNP